VSDRKQQGGPQGWKRTTLGEALPIHYGKARNDRYGTVRVNTPVYGSSGRIDTFNRALTSGPSLIIGRKGNVGAAYYSPEPCWPIDTVYFAEASEKEDLRFFKYLLDHLQLVRKDRSTAVPGLSRDDYNATEVLVPELDQQRLVVAEIEKQFSRLDEAVANLKRVKANLKRYKASVLKAAGEGKLTEDWRKRHPNVEPANKLLERILAARRAKWNGRGKYKEPTALATNDLPSLPKGWTWATVEQLAAGYVGAIQSGPFGSQLLHSEFVDHGILAIGIDNVLDGKFSLGRQHRITPAKFETLRKFEARPRDVVITVMATVGRVCVLPQSLERAIITKHCYRITPVSGNVEPDFLAIALRADSATRQYIFGNVRGQTRPGINGSILKAAPVSLPPLAEQQLIVAEVERPLSVIDKLEAAAEANLIRADRLRQAILSRAFGSDLPSDNSLPLASDKEVSMKSKNLPLLPAPRETSAEDKRLDLIEVISRYPNGLPVETLFVDAGYQGDQIDQFYRDLSVFASRIEQEVPSDEGAVWPFAGLVRVRLKA
jgi:type I restriction enzyme S subunit